MQFQAVLRDGSRSALVVLAGVVAVFALSGCHRPPAADVVATVNGKEILHGDLEKYYKASLGDSPQEPPAEQANIQRLSLLHGMIEDEILQQRAAKLNLAATDEDVNARLTEMKAPYTQEEFDRQLKQRNITVDDLKRDIRRTLTKTKLLNKEIESKIDITDAEIANYYNTNKSEFNLIEQTYHLARIIVTGAPPQQNGTPQTRKPFNEVEAHKEIQGIHNRLDSGEDFGALASQFSENTNSAASGGDMGFIPESQLQADPEVYNQISKLKPNQITDIQPVYDGAGPSRKIVAYAIYKLLGRDAAGQRELNDPRVQLSIRQDLRNRKVQLLQNAYLEMLHDDAKVRNYFAEQILKSGAQ